MKYICIVTIPSNNIYGFDGVSDKEFEIYQRNVSRILSLTSLGYDKEFAPNTDCSSYVWSDSDDWLIDWDGLKLGATPVNEDDEIVFLSYKFSLLETKYDFFVEMLEEEIKKIASEFQNIIDKYNE